MKIDFIFVCVKADLGYFEACGQTITDANLDIERFMRDELGLNNLIDATMGSFHSVRFCTSSVKPQYKDKLTKLFVDTLKKMGVS